MKKERLMVLSALMLIFCLVSFASAAIIHVKTVPNGKVHIFVLSPDEVYLLLNSYHIQSNSSGEVSANYNGGESNIKILVQVTRDGLSVMNEQFGEFPNKGDIYLRAIPGNVSDNYKAEEDAATAKAAEEEAKKKAAEESAAKAAEESAVKAAAEEAARIKAEEEANSTIFTGLATAFTSITDKINTTYVFIGIIGFIIVGSIFFFVVRIKRDSTPEYIPKKGGKAEEKWHVLGRPYEKRLEDAEDKIKKATSELNALKSMDKVQQAKRDVEMARQRLLKLQKGE